MNLRELSALLGLSQTTVSRALNGFPEVSEETRVRALEAARLHNYRPNSRARSLATGRAMAIGMVIPVSTQQEMVNPVFADFVAGVGEVLSAADHDIILTVVPDAEEPSAYRRLKAKSAVDGVIIQAPRIDDPRIPLLTEVGLPFVIHGRSSAAALPYSWLDVNNRRAFERATTFLLDLGHRRIAFLNGLEFMEFAHRRRAGFESAFAARGLTPDPVLMRSEDMTEAYGHRVGAELLALPDPPTAFLTSSLIIAIGVRRAIEDRGLRMGRDVSIVTHDDDLGYFRNGEEVPIFTATRSSVREAGRLCAQMLLQQIADPHVGRRERLLEAELIVGQSTGPARARGRD